MNNVNKQIDIKWFLHQNKIGLYGLVETKIKSANFQSVLNNLGQRWYGINNNVHHPGGRIWIIWLPQVFYVLLLDSSDQQLTVEVTDILSGVKFWFTVVYGSNSDTDRLHLWHQLTDLKDRCLGPWCVGGDFNNILHFNERLGSTVLWKELEDFRSCVDYCELLDIQAQGSFYTWNNKNPGSAIRKSHFRYFNMWGQAPEFLDIVHSEWNKVVKGVKMYQVVCKLKSLKKPLKGLNRQKFSDIEKAADLAKFLLDKLQTEMHLHPHDVSIREQEQAASQKYFHLHKAQLSYLKQKAKVEWLKDGDENTAFFHRHIRARQVQNNVLIIKDIHGSLQTEPVQIEAAFLEYYNDLLGTSKVTDSVHYPTVRTGNLIASPHLPLLLKPDTHDEIKQCIFSIPASKAPGPDGFSSQFIKDSWSIIVTELNATLVTLIPKVDNPTSALEFRPIACCNLIYKCISKLLCTRLGEVLPDIFPQVFIDKIMECVSSPTYSLALNGNSFGFFHGKRGLRQGDPLSPLLFTLCMEYLSRILNVMAGQEDFRFHPLCRPMRLNHLLFADDLLLFSKGDTASIMWLLRAFSTFSNASGLCLNREKSDIYFNEVSGGVMDEIMQVSGFRKGTLAFKYLGVPISSKKLSKNDFLNLRGGGIKNSKLWNKALLGKYIWWLANKKDHLWVRRVNHIYMKGVHWSNYNPPNDCSWAWKKVAHTMLTFKQAYTSDCWLASDRAYTVADGYQWLCPVNPQIPWRHVCWSSLNVPKWCFIFGAVQLQRLLTKDRMIRMGFGHDSTCFLCDGADENCDTPR
ncbi:uncharacterized protein LOC141657573 [Silene latifolia]|uniref:uncharacterized protein LOC141657573 n=1 Tax=Silene latifolia TaxID=37657 RepID=UPI003D77368C